MIEWIKDIEVYAPEPLGVKQILMAGGKSIAIEDHLTHPPDSDIKVREGKGLIATPGFIDSHVHLLGGGGEGGFDTRTPEIQLTDLTLGGVTTVVGCLGTDGFTRRMESLVAKCRGLEKEGVSAYCYTGSYQVPVRTLTSSIEEDLLLIDPIIGVGEIAISDHRSSQPTRQELEKIAAASRIGGILSNKKGVVNLHLGSGSRGLDVIDEICSQTEIPYSQFLPTHINQNEKLFAEALEICKKGGLMDFTTSTTEKFLEEGEIPCGKALKRALEEGVDIGQITFSSDGQGSLPDFDANGNFRGLMVGKVTSLYEAVREGVEKEGLDLSTALKVITSNPAEILGLRGKGALRPGFDGDLVLLKKENLTIHSVYAKGRLMVNNGKPVVKGTFEEAE